MTKKSSDPVDELRDRLLGPIEDWPAEDVLETIADANLDLDSVKRRVYDAANRAAGVFRERNERVPAHLTAVLRALWPAELPTSEPVQAEVGARKWIRRILQPGPNSSSQELAYAFRGRDTTIAPDDAAVLEELARELEDETKNPGEP